MPLIDVSEVLLDPDFCETITIIRRTQTVGSDGVAVYAETPMDITAVVTAGNPDKLARGAESQVAKDSITVISQTPLHGPTQGKDADIVVWSGNRYVVRKVYDWSHYGSGFTASDCEMTDLVNAA